MIAWVPSRRSLARIARVLPVAILALPALAWIAILFLALSRAHFDAPSPTLLVRDRQGRFLGELAASGDERLGYWPLAAVPERVAQATIAIEDRRFFAHPGVDPLAVLRAVRQNVGHGQRVSGASTLAMQVARMAHPGARGYARKAVEAATAVLLTARYGREGVLRQYLRVVPYGNNLHGIGYAARRYFDKPVEDLSWAEIAFLAAIPQSPARMNPYDPAGKLRAERRGRQILDRLAAQGVLSAAEHGAALAEIERLRVPPRTERPPEALQALFHYADLAAERGREARPLVESTIDLDLQREAEWLAWRTVADAADKGAGNAALLIVDRQTWQVRAAVSSTGYFDREHAGAIDYLRLPRSPGSTLKPFVFALALERGTIAPNTVLDDLGPGPGGMVNADDRFLGPLLPRAALGNSRNVPAVDLVARLGLDSTYDFLGDLGLHAHAQPARRYGLGLAIGTLAVTLEDLVRAYTALAGDGRLQSLRWLGDEKPEEPRAVLSPEVARAVTLFLADPQARLPTFPRMGAAEFPFAVALKTGTSSRYRDAWTIAWSRRYLVGVWVGHPDEREMSHLSGYRIAARLAHDVLTELQESELDGLSDVDFPPPAGWRQERICPLSGQRAGPACDRVALEWLPPSTPPLDECTAHRRVAIDRTSGLVATAATPARDIDVRTVLDLPGRYAAWLDRQSLPQLSDLNLPKAPGLEGTLSTRLAVLSPENDARLLLDPETPAALNTLGLRAVAEPTLPQLVWYVDGAPYRTVDPPYDLRWPLARGEHVFQVRAPYGGLRSPVVRVMVN